jgi:hypothetical protein
MRSAIHVASLTSLLRPGTLRTCAAFAKTSWKRSSSTCQDSNKRPLLSMATCVTPDTRHFQKPARRCRNGRTSWLGLPRAASRTQATTSSVETSTPSIEHLHRPLLMWRTRRDALADETYPTCCSGYTRSCDQAQRLPQQSRALEGPPAKLGNGLACTKAEPTSVPIAPHSPYQFHASGCTDRPSQLS